MSTKDIAKPRTKPTKPYPDFPLFAHATRRWAKKIRGKLVFFGPWEDPDGALQQYLDQKDELHAGRVPRAVNPEDGLTLRELVNHFLTAKQRKVQAGELKPMSFNSLHRTCRDLIEFIGRDRRVDDITPDDFGRLRSRFAKGHGPVYTDDQVQRTRTVFKYGYEGGLLPSPMRFGPEFVKPPRKNVRLAKHEGPKQLFEQNELKVLKVASVPMKAMILLGINCAMGNTDLAELRISAIDLKNAVIGYPRPKTGVDRRCPLWPETVKAIKAALKERPTPSSDEHADLLFITRFGNPWIQVGPPSRLKCHKCRSIYLPGDEDPPRCPSCGAIARPRKTQASMTDSVGNEFKKLFPVAKIERRGRGLYALRHTFRTVADEVGDRPAIDKIMGHENPADMRTHYVEKIDDRRLRKVTEHVSQWLRIT